MSDSLRVMCCQIDIPVTVDPHQRDQHLAASASRVEAALTNCTVADGKAVRLIVLPELSSIDYSRPAFASLSGISEPLDGASFQCWRKIARAHDVYILYGFARDTGHDYRICSAIVSPDGSLAGFYDKLHLAQFGDSMELEYFGSAGEQLLVVEIDGITVAPIICYDIRFPELARVLVTDHGVDAICTWEPMRVILRFTAGITQ